MATLFKRILRIMRFIMPLFYLAVGLLLTFSKFLGEETGRYRLVLGILLMGYSVFRAWRVLKDPVNFVENETSTE